MQNTAPFFNITWEHTQTPSLPTPLTFWIFLHIIHPQWKCQTRKKKGADSETKTDDLYQNIRREIWRGGFMFIVYYCMSLSACMSLPVCSFRFSFVLVCIFCCVSLIRDGVYHRWPHDGLCRFWSPESWQHWDEGSTATKRAYDYLNLERVGWDIYQNDKICFF